MRFVPYDEFGMNYSDELLQNFHIRKVYIMLNIFYICHVSLRWIFSTSVCHDTTLGFQAVSKTSVFTPIYNNFLGYTLKIVLFETTWKSRGASWKIFIVRTHNKYKKFSTLCKIFEYGNFVRTHRNNSSQNRNMAQNALVLWPKKMKIFDLP